MRQSVVEKTNTAASKARSVRPTKALSASTPRYKGTIVEEELVRNGGALLAMLSGRAQELEHNRSEMSTHLGVTYGYIAQLTSGHRKCEHISMEFADACTKYLGVPKMTVLMAAGVVKPEDTFERPDDLGTALPLALQFVSRDPVFGPLMPAELFSDSANPALQFFVIRLYEAATKRKFIPGEHSVHDIAKSLQAIERRRKELMS
jgi:hypothetical protein